MVTSVIKFWLNLAKQKTHNNSKGVVYVAVEREHGPSVMSLRMAIAAKAKIIVDEEETQAFPIPSVVAKFLPQGNESDKTRILPLRPLSHQQLAVNNALHHHRTNHKY